MVGFRGIFSGEKGEVFSVLSLFIFIFHSEIFHEIWNEANYQVWQEALSLYWEAVCHQIAGWNSKYSYERTFLTFNYWKQHFLNTEKY